MDIQDFDPSVWPEPNPSYYPFQKNHPFHMKSDLLSGGEIRSLTLCDGTELVHFVQEKEGSSESMWLAYLSVWLPLSRMAPTA